MDVGLVTFGARWLDERKITLATGQRHDREMLTGGYTRYYIDYTLL